MTEYYKILSPSRNSLLVKSPKYKLHYERGTIVNKVEGSIGIFIFNNLNYAQGYKNWWGSKNCLIIKVKPIGVVKHIDFIAIDQKSKSLNKFYKVKPSSYNSPYQSSVRKNHMIYSICCDSLEVLE